ncbi:baseplate J/gp47 family protein [Candidatus Tokpelaia sp.]|uniref:baseplate J/gp47 family protein n=1 Tax=Candidatus Tokpelaia sp. TaxID=2233777 RepID=UPI001238F4DF|nr:baseplate J/gp47 family protein [Candidatus Tokpelaia sp.]KAA6405668.1 baseplate assembly protein [Candidatus Tokpelaia sp.]
MAELNSKPEIIEELSATALLERKKALLQSLYDKNGLPFNVSAIAYDPANIQLEVSVFDELLLRARINDAARATLLAFATGSNLDALGDFHGVLRLPNETDEAYRRRIRLFVSGARGGGTADYYRYHALSANSAVKDAIVYRQGKSPIIYIAVFGDTADGSVGEQLLADIAAYMRDPKICMTSDTLEIVSAVRIFVPVKAEIWLYQAAQANASERAAANLRSRWQDRQALGRPLTQSFIISSLMIDDVARVHLQVPAEDIEAAPNEAIAITDIELTLRGYE